MAFEDLEIDVKSTYSPKEQDLDSEEIDLGYFIYRNKEKTSLTSRPYEVDESGVVLFRGSDGKIIIPGTSYIKN